MQTDNINSITQFLGEQDSLNFLNVNRELRNKSKFAAIWKNIFKRNFGEFTGGEGNFYKRWVHVQSNWHSLYQSYLAAQPPLPPLPSLRFYNGIQPPSLQEAVAYHSNKFYILETITHLIWFTASEATLHIFSNNYSNGQRYLTLDNCLASTAWLMSSALCIVIMCIEGPTSRIFERIRAFKHDARNCLVSEIQTARHIYKFRLIQQNLPD